MGEKSLFQQRKAENKKRFGLSMSFFSIKGHLDTGGICTYEDMLSYKNFKATFDFDNYEKSDLYNDIDVLIANAKLNGCKYCEVVAS